MTLGSWFGKRWIELINNRSLFVSVTPVPTNLSERRAVLHALQRHGPIEVFKKITLSDEFICAPVSIKVAGELVRQSPLTFNFVPETLLDPGSKAAPGAYPSRVAAPIKTYQLTETPNENNPTHRTGPIRTFTLQIRPSQRDYAHRTEIRRNPIHFRWPKSPAGDKDAIFWALREVVPGNLAREGLCDWHTGGQFSDDAQAMRISADYAELWNQFERQHKHERPKDLSWFPGELVTWKSVVGQIPGFAASAPGSAQGPNPDNITKSESFKNKNNLRRRLLQNSKLEEGTSD